jgi:acylphosphatase
LSAHVTGRVQGVGFRAATRRRAEQLGLTGWVRNRADGSVELVAEGLETALHDLIAFLVEGPPAAVVTDVESAWSEPTNEFTAFRIRYT